MKHHVFLDASVILDFTEPKDNDVFEILKQFIERWKGNTVFCSTDYIFYSEINRSSFLSVLQELIEEYNVNENFYTQEPPPNIDLGEWSIFIAIKELSSEGKSCCVLCSDGTARDFFKEHNLLPCQALTPPAEGVGGALGILKHFVLEGILTQEQAEEIVNKMLQVGRRMPRKTDWT